VFGALKLKCSYVNYTNRTIAVKSGSKIFDILLAWWWVCINIETCYPHDSSKEW